MKFKKINLISLSVLSIFSISVSSVFAGRTGLLAKNKANRVSSSVTNGKKPSVEKGMPQKNDPRIYFCFSCGRHLNSARERCTTAKCVAQPISGIPTNELFTVMLLKSCLESDIEEAKKEFPSCPVCKSHDIKLMMSGKGGSRIEFCYKCCDRARRALPSRPVIFRSAFKPVPRTEEPDSNAVQTSPSKKKEMRLKLTWDNLEERSMHDYITEDRIIEWMEEGKSVKALYPHPLTFENLSDL